LTIPPGASRKKMQSAWLLAICWFVQPWKPFNIPRFALWQITQEASAE
jgi:hypothetical protein